MGGSSDGTPRHEEWFKGGRWSVYKERLFGVGGFPFLLALLVLLYSKASTTLKQFWFLSCLASRKTNFEAPCPDYDITIKSTISLTSDPTHYSNKVPTNSRQCWGEANHLGMIHDWVLVLAGCEVHRRRRLGERIIFSVQLEALILTWELLLTQHYLHCLESISPTVVILPRRSVGMDLGLVITWLHIGLSLVELYALQLLCMCQFDLEKQPVSVG